MVATKPLCIPDAARWNEYVAVPLAFVANLFLAFLIIVRSPKSLKIYNRVLLTNCVCDLTLSAACLIIGYHTSIRHGIAFAVNTGLFAGSSSYERFMAATVWIVTQDAALLYLCVPFIFRYFAVCRNYIMTAVEFVVLLVLMISLALIGPASLWIYYWPLTKEMLEDRSVPQAPLTCENPGQLPLFRASDAFTLRGIMPIVLTSVVLSGSYVTIAWTSIKIRNHMKGIASTSKKTIRLQQQLNRALLLQAVSSWVVSCVPLTLAVGILLFAVEGGSVILECESSAVAWIPVVNPTLTMLCISAYRREAVRLLRGLIGPLLRKGSSPVMELSSVTGITPSVHVPSQSLNPDPII